MHQRSSASLAGSLGIGGLPIPAFHALCSVKLARVAWPQLERHKLDHVAAHFGIPLNHHDALSDARACAEITVRAFQSGIKLPLSFKQRELTAGLAARMAKATYSRSY